MRFVKQNTPRVILLENVQALLNHDGGKSFARIQAELEGEGYDVIHKVLKCSDYGIPQMRKRLFIVAFKNICVSNINDFFDLGAYKKATTMKEYLGKNFVKDIAYTLRCGGRASPIDDRHNWDGYWVDGQVHRLTTGEGLKLQGFEEYELVGKDTEKWKMLGNSIPTIFTEIMASQLIKHCQF